MKKLLIAACLLSAASGAMAQNIDIHIGGSGYYGRIDMGNLGRPPVLYQEPMFIERPREYRSMQPLYLRVPPGHAKKWSKHCAAYNACGQPVYFVQDSWYNNTYAPRYRESHLGYSRDNDRNFRNDDRYRDDGKRDKHEGKHGNKHDRDDDDDNGNEHGKGHGKGHGKD